MKQDNIQMPIVNQNAAGIDIGSRSHFVSIGQGKQQVREFGVYSEDLTELALWLVENNIETVAMESTGDYWQNLYTELIKNHIDVYLVNGKFTKTMNRKKTDVIDCQWIQKLHSLGLLNRCFLPDEATEKLRTLCRQRANIIAAKADASRKMQKYLKFLNFRLDIVVKDITGQTGLAIIDAITNGEHDIDSMPEVTDELPSEKPYKKINKNSIKTIDLNIVAFQYFGGVDLLEIPGVSYGTVLSIMSEVGPNGLDKFPTSKHFTSWLRLAPNNKISGGRRISSKVPKGSHRLKVALRNAAYSIARLKNSPLHKFYKKIAFKKGAIKAVTATARKLATIIWNMITKKTPYQAHQEYIFLDQKRKQIAMVRKKIAKFGINPNDLGLFTRPRLQIAYQKKLSDNQ